MSARQRQFEALVNAYSADLYRYAMWLCHRQEQAEDLVQETFMRAWKGLDSLRDDRAAKYWLITILRREHARAYHKTPQDQDSIDDMDLERYMPLSHSDGHDDADAVSKALASLPESYREPLVLQVLGGYTCNEIADMMGIKSQTVMTRVFRARQALRKWLQGDDAELTTTGINK